MTQYGGAERERETCQLRKISVQNSTENARLALIVFLQFLSLSFTITELMLFTCARSIHINTDRKQLKQVLHFRLSFEPRFSEVDKSHFLAPPLRTTSCNVHYSGPILYE
jgi:hypothetical protein